MQKIAKSINEFKDIRQIGCVYVDKTAYLHSLITKPEDRCLFISRPRRFGKSLMITTLKAIFQGRRELFDGLAIADTDWDWTPYTVLHFKFGMLNVSTLEDFREAFATAVRGAYMEAKLDYDLKLAPENNFALTLMSAKENSLVILIDEYDDPVAQALDEPAKAELIRKNLAGFYGKMKDNTGVIRFLMITGVSKFTKLSLFSAMSNLTDLTFKPETAGMLGFTEEELDTYFSEHMQAHAEKMKLPQEQYRAELKRMFNGYRFSPDSDVTVYNPVSIGNNMSEQNSRFTCSWAETGKASMLMNYLERKEFIGIDMEAQLDVDEDDFEVMDLRHLRPVSMLYQTGYLTIKNYDPRSGSYTLGVPDEEVRRDLAAVLTGLAAGQDTSWAKELGRMLLKAKWDKFTVGLKSLYAHLPYGPKESSVQEFSYERILVTLLKSQGFRVISEDRQTAGRADVVAEHACGVYIFELKVDDTADNALAQVRQKHYDQPYLADSRPIWLVGISFDGATRQLVELKAVSNCDRLRGKMTDYETDSDQFR